MSDIPASDVSVVIPCHNAEPYLAQTIGSVLEQTRPPREIVVVDDGSTDASLSIACRVRERFPRQVRVLSERSGNAAGTRNLGALAATGAALMFLDADDVLAPDTLEALSVALVRASAGIALCPWFRLDRSGDQWIARPPSCRPRRQGEDVLTAWLSGWYHPPCSVLWSRTAFEAAGRWEEVWNPNDDGDLMMRALATGTSVATTTAGAGFYRRLPAGQASLSGHRLTHAGLAAKLRTLRKTACWLDEHRRLAVYRRPLRHAFRQLAEDAAGIDDRLRRQALSEADRHAPPLVARLAHRYLRRKPPAVAALPTPVGEIRCGLPTAAMVAGAAHTVPACDAGVPNVDRCVRPSVSVVIPTYNRARLLPRALDSVLAQTFGNLEVLVIDDGSTDGTTALMARYHDPRVRYLVQPANAGVSAARNRGMREARGEWIAFLDSDDEWLPDKLQRQLARSHELAGLGEADTNVGMIYCGFERISDDGTHAVRIPTCRGDIYADLLVNNVISGTPGVMIRRAVVATAGFFDETIAAIEDYDYWLRVARFHHIDFVAEPLVRFHDHGGNGRKSAQVRENLSARAHFHRKHAAALAEARVAHLFLLKSARRHLTHPAGNTLAAFGLALRTLGHAPTSRQAWRTLACAFPLRRPLRVIRQRLRPPSTSPKANAKRPEEDAMTEVASR